MTKSVHVSVTVGYELRTIILSANEWKNVKSGKELTKSVDDYYEGETFTYDFRFNGDMYDDASLVVTYDDGGVGLIGKIKNSQQFSYYFS